jgi:hypothetical protein
MSKFIEKNQAMGQFKLEDLENQFSEHFRHAPCKMDMPISTPFFRK